MFIHGGHAQGANDRDVQSERLLEMIPFSANLAGLSLTSFGIALIARDGLLALISLAATGGTFVVIVMALDNI